jgi:O-acetyl-ADP-ribose deacetylase (regulator of RNase III)
VYRDGKQGEAELLASCYRKCFHLAEEHSVRSISFPSISTGAYGYPMREASGVALREVAEQLKQAEGCVREAIFVLFDQRSYEIYAEVSAGLLPGLSQTSEDRA